MPNIEPDVPIGADAGAPPPPNALAPLPMNVGPVPEAPAGYRPSVSATVAPVDEMAVKQNKSWRVELDNILQRIKNAPRKSRNRSLAITHLEDVIMRLGMDLKEIGTPDPYPNSYKPENTVVDKTADGLKL